jgi:hypothetical protein
MAHQQYRPRGLPHEKKVLCFSMPRRRQKEQGRALEQSASRATTYRRSESLASSTLLTAHLAISSSPTPADVNNPLPLLLSEVGKNTCDKPASLRSLLRNRHSRNRDPSHLQSESHSQRQQHSFISNSLHLGMQSQNPCVHSCSTLYLHCEDNDAATSSGAASPPLACSDAESDQYQIECQSYSAQCEHHPSLRQRAISMDPYAKTTPPHVYTSPSTTTVTTTTRNCSSSKP